jgi:hypothetical protein
MIVKASEAIQLLKGYAPDEEIYIMWWDSDIIEMYLDDKVSEDKWNDVVADMENNSVGSEDVSEYIIDKVGDVA